jgi:hypothetical protein
VAVEDDESSHLTRLQSTDSRRRRGLPLVQPPAKLLGMSAPLLTTLKANVAILCLNYSVGGMPPHKVRRYHKGTHAIVAA